MSGAKLAWEAFMRVLAEITEAKHEGASADDIQELFQHAGELLEIMGEEIESEPAEARAAMRSAVTAMRARLFQQHWPSTDGQWSARIGRKQP